MIIIVITLNSCNNIIMMVIIIIKNVINTGRELRNFFLIDNGTCKWPNLLVRLYFY